MILKIRNLLNIKGSSKSTGKSPLAVVDGRMMNQFVKPQAILLRPMIFSVNANACSHQPCRNFLRAHGRFSGRRAGVQLGFNRASGDIRVVKQEVMVLTLNYWCHFKWVN